MNEVNSMKAVHMDEHGSPDVLTIRRCQIPVPYGEEVLIKVHYAGVNKPDALQRAGLYNPPADANPLLGLEVSGEIVSVGEKVKKWGIGDLVTALVPGGGYAEYALTNENHALPVPHGLNMNQAAALCETFFTVWTNVFLRGNLKAGEKFLVHGGSSGIGTTAIQLAKAFGAEIYTTAGSELKCASCRKLGARLAVNYKTQNFVDIIKKEIGKAKINLILDMVGGDYTEKNLSLLAEEGRLVLIGFLGGHDAKVNFTRVMMKRLSITGSTLRAQSIQNKTIIAQDLLEKVWPLINAGEVKPVIDSTFQIDDVIEAHKRLEASQHIGKITLKLMN